jgi:hypothetical protein
VGGQEGAGVDRAQRSHGERLTVQRSRAARHHRRRDPGGLGRESPLRPWPKEWKERHFNACTEPCDMLVGPCACGAWRSPECWPDVLRYYKAEIRDYPLDATPDVADLGDLEFQKSQATLSYF